MPIRAFCMNLSLCWAYVKRCVFWRYDEFTFCPKSLQHSRGILYPGISVATCCIARHLVVKRLLVNLLTARSRRLHVFVLYFFSVQLRFVNAIVLWRAHPDHELWYGIKGKWYTFKRTIMSLQKDFLQKKRLDISLKLSQISSGGFFQDMPYFCANHEN